MGSRNTLKYKLGHSFNSVTLIQMEMTMHMYQHWPAPQSLLLHYLKQAAWTKYWQVPKPYTESVTWVLWVWSWGQGQKVNYWASTALEIRHHPLFMKRRNSYRKTCFTCRLLLLQDKHKLLGIVYAELIEYMRSLYWTRSQHFWWSNSWRISC